MRLSKISPRCHWRRPRYCGTFLRWDGKVISHRQQSSNFLFRWSSCCYILYQGINAQGWAGQKCKVSPKQGRPPYRARANQSYCWCPRRGLPRYDPRPGQITISPERISPFKRTGQSTSLNARTDQGRKGHVLKASLVKIKGRLTSLTTGSRYKLTLSWRIQASAPIKGNSAA